MFSTEHSGPRFEPPAPPAVLLNSQLASALGRPDLAFSVGMRPFSVQAVPVGFSEPSQTDAGGTAFSGPVLALMVAVIGYAAFVYWVRPHLA